MWRQCLSLLLFVSLLTGATFTWTNPTTRTDGSPLTNLVGTRLKCGPQSGGPYTLLVDVPAPGTSHEEPTANVEGKWCVGTAYDTNAFESAFSNEVTLAGTPPTPVPNLTVQLSKHEAPVMAIVEVGGGTQRATAPGGSDDRTLAFPGNVGSGNLLIVAGAGFKSGGVAAPGVTDTLGTSYTVLSAVPFTNGRIFIAYGVSPSAGANTVTIDWAGAVGNSFSINEYSGQHATPLDVDGGSSTGTSTTPADSLTTLSADDLLIGVVAHDGTSTITPGTDYTQIGEEEDNTLQDHGAEFRLVTTAQAYSVNWTLGTSSPWGVYTAAFKPAAAAAAAKASQSLVGSVAGWFP